MNQFSLKGKPSLEDLAEPTDQLARVAITPISEDEYDRQNPQLNMAEEEIEYLNSAIDAHSVVASYYDQLSDKKTDISTLTMESAIVINNTIRTTCVKVGLEDYPQISLANFESRSAKRDAINVSLEGFTEVIRRLLEIIGRVIKKIYEFVHDDIEGAIRGASGVLRRTNVIQDRALAVLKSSTTAGQPNGITQKDLVRFFNKDGKVYSPTEITTAYERYNRILNEHFAGNILESVVNSAVITMESDIRKVGAANYTQQHAFKASDNALNYLKNHGLKDFTSASAAGADTLSYVLPFGNAALNLVLMVEDGCYTGLDTDLEVNKINVDGAMPVLTPIQIREYCRMIEVQMNSGIYRDYRKIKSTITKAGKSIENICKYIATEQSNAASGTVASLSFLKSIITALVALTRALYQYNGVCARRLMSYCEVSVRVWE